VLEEYQRVAQELSSKFPSVNINRVLEMIAAGAELVDTKEIKQGSCRRQVFGLRHGRKSQHHSEWRQGFIGSFWF